MWKIEIDNRVHLELEDIFYYYLENGGFEVVEKFTNSYENCINSLEINPEFQIRYNKINCLPIPYFPFMIHFHIDKENYKVIVLSVISTYQDPKEKWIY